MASKKPSLVRLNSLGQALALGQSAEEMKLLPDSFTTRLFLPVGRRSLPDIRTLFGQDIDLFQDQTRAGGLTNSNDFGAITNNAKSGFIVSCPFLLCALCIMVEAPIEAASIAAFKLARSQVSGDIPALGPAAEYCNVAAAAMLNVGFDAWRAYRAFFHAFDLRLELGCDFNLMDEHLEDLGDAGQEELHGAGIAQREAVTYFRQYNDQKYVKDGGYALLPSTALPPCTNADGYETGTSSPLPAPTASPIVGGPRQEGIWGGCFPFKRRLVLLPHMPAGLILSRRYATDAEFQDFCEALAASPTVNSYGEGIGGTGVISDRLHVFTLNGATTAVASIAPGVDVNVGADGVIPNAALIVCEDAQGVVTVKSRYSVIMTNGQNPPQEYGPNVDIPLGNGNFDLTQTVIVTPVGQSNTFIGKMGDLAVNFTIKGFRLSDLQAAEFYVSGVASRNDRRTRMLYSVHGQKYLAGIMTNAVLGRIDTALSDAQKATGALGALPAQKATEIMRELVQKESVQLSDEVREEGDR